MSTDTKNLRGGQRTQERSKHPVAECFIDEEGTKHSTAFLDGYWFGDTQLENVAFRCTLDGEGYMTVEPARPNSSYVKSLNMKHWCKEALAFAEKHQEEFYADENLSGEELVIHGRHTPLPKRPPPKAIGPAEPPKETRREPETKPAWKNTQDSLMREVLSELGRQRMTSQDLCRRAGISTSHWSELKNLKKPISLDRLLSVASALGMEFTAMLLHPPHPTIRRKELAQLACINSPRLPLTVVDNGVVKKWVGIGWVTEDRDPLPSDTVILD